MARTQHYTFAHRTLPQLFLSDAERFLKTLAAEGDPFLAFLWNSAGTTLEEEEWIDPRNLGYTIYKETVEDETTTLALITLPTPYHVPEAYFLALLRYPDGGTRVMTLEFGRDVLTEAPYTVLGEWTKDGTHHNLGDGPEPNADAFLTHVRKNLL